MDASSLQRRVYGDTLFVIDPYVDLLLATALIAGRYRPRRREFAARLALALVLVYVLGRVELRNIARRQLSSFAVLQPGYMSSAVGPRMLTPLAWTGIVETRDEIFQVDLQTTDGGIGQELVRLRKAADSRVIAAARRTPSAQALLAFARFPVIQVHSEADGSGHRVEFIDFRFYRPATDGAVSLAAVVELDSSLNVVRESLGFTERLQRATSASTDGSP